MIGVLNGCAVFYRFAAADAADEAFKSRAISLVLAGGVVAAFTGPNLARLTMNWIEGTPFAGSFAVLIGGASDRRHTFVGVTDPAREKRRRLPVRDDRWGSFSETRFSSWPRGRHGRLCRDEFGDDDGHAFTSAAFVIQWHIFGMFAPSFFTGLLIARIGASRTIAMGAALILLCVGSNLAGQEVINFPVALLALACLSRLTPLWRRPESRASTTLLSSRG
jgi:hypothetical protein